LDVGMSKYFVPAFYCVVEYSSMLNLGEGGIWAVEIVGRFTCSLGSDAGTKSHTTKEMDGCFFTWTTCHDFKNRNIL
jgi:hypothetical protein